MLIITMATAFDNVMSSVRTYLGYDPMGPDNPHRGRRNRAIEVGRALVALGISGGAYNYFKNKILGTNTMYRPKRPAFGRRRRTRRTTKKRQYKKSVSRKPRKSFTRRRTSLKKEVKQIKKQLNADNARHVYKLLGSGTVSCSVNSSNYAGYDIITGSVLDGVYLAQLRYYDPSAPGTLVTASAGTGTYERTVFVKNVHSHLEVRNNYQIPVKVKVYLVKPKGDTAITPTTYYNNSITDQAILGGSVVTNGIYPTDLTAFMAQWSCKCVKDVTLDAGAFTIATHNSGSFHYDPSLFDSHSLDYQNKFKACAWFIRVEGVIGHDTSANQQTTMLGQVDLAYTHRCEVIYDAGIKLDDIYINNTRTGFTNGGVVTNKPIADNQALSVA